MDLRSYLRLHGVEYAAFAGQIGVGLQSLYRYMAGERIPRMAIILRIAKATDGHVQANDFMPREPDDGDLAAQPAKAA